jgi:hypothetical protein
MRKYWNTESATDLAKVLGRLCEAADGLATDKVVPNFVNPLAAAIASRF